MGARNESCKVLLEYFERRLTSRLPYPQRLNDHGSNQARIAQRGERNKMDATGKVLNKAICHLDRETRFADSSRPRDRNQSHVLPQE